MLSSRRTSTPRARDFRNLIETVHLDFQHRLRIKRARGPNRLRQTIARAHERQVVVLDQKAVVEAEAMIGPAPATHGIFLQRAQAGKRSCGCRVSSFSSRPRHRRNGAFAVATPESCWRKLSAHRSAGEDRGRRAANLQHRVAGLGATCHRALPRGQDQCQGPVRGRPARPRAGRPARRLPSRKSGRGLRLEFNASQRRDIGRPAILAQRARRRLADDGRVGRSNRGGIRTSVMRELVDGFARSAFISRSPRVKDRLSESGSPRSRQASPTPRDISSCRPLVVLRDGQFESLCLQAPAPRLVVRCRAIFASNIVTTIQSGFIANAARRCVSASGTRPAS